MSSASTASTRVEADKDTEKGSDFSHDRDGVGKSHFEEIKGQPSGAAEGEHSSAEATDEPSVMTKVLSRISRTSITGDPGPPPDGGLGAWTQVFAGHLIVGVTWGYINSYGVFQTYYTQALGHPPSDISWIGSVQIWLLFGIGTFSGRATDAGFFRVCVGVGVALQLLGVFMTSLSTQYWQLLLSHGITVGLGNGMVFCPTVALIATYFEKNRAFALSIAASGTATGGMLFPGLVEALLPRVGFGWTVRTIGFVMLVLQGVAAALVRTRLPPRRTGPLVDWDAFRERPYSFFAAGVFFMFWGVYPAFYYVGAFGARVLGTDQSMSINLLLVMNGIGVPARVIPGFISDKVTGPMNLLIPCTALSGVVLYCWIAVHDIAGLIAFSVFYGICGAMIQGIFPAALSSLTTDVNRMGTRIGMVFSIISFAALTGSPIFGALIQKDGGAYLAGQLFSGTTLVAASLMLIASRVARTGWRLRIKV